MQWVVAVNEELVARMEALEVFECGDSCGFAVFAAGAVLTGKDQIPASVEVSLQKNIAEADIFPSP